ncbi:MMPL family transporter [Sphingosinicellaceae bacterium]|nr:MMPL family transporter [Sphingosinicellaceae bacterium]
MPGPAPSTPSLVERAVALAVAFPRAVIVGALLLTLAAGAFAARHFDMTTDTAALIAPTVEWRRDEAVIDAAFPQNRDPTAVVVDGATPEAAELGARALAAAMARDTAHFRTVRRPDATAFFAQNGLLFATTPEVSDATARLVAAQPFLGPLAADPSLRGVMTSLSTVLTGVSTGSAKLSDIADPVRALGDGLGGIVAGKQPQFSWTGLFGATRGALAAPTRRVIVAQAVLDYGDLTPGAAASDAARGLATSLKLDPAHGVRVRLTGAVPLADEEFASLADGAGIVGAVMAGSMLLLLWVATRSAKIVAAIAVTIVAGLVVTAALGLALVGRFNLISVAFIPLFVGLGIDFAIQLSVRFRAETDPDTATALRRAGRTLGHALVVAAAAVALGFAAFLPTAYIGISELGIIAAVGMGVALALSVTLLPALLVLLNPSRIGDPGLTRFAPAEHWLQRHRKAVLWAFAASMLASIALLPLVSFDFDPYNLRNPNGEAMATLADLMRDPNRTPNTVDVLAPDDAAAARLSARLSALPEVSQVVDIASFIPADQPAKLALIADARNLLEFTLDPFAVAARPTDAETVVALRRTASRLRTAASTDTSPAAAPAVRLAGVLEALATAPPGHRAAATTMLVPPLTLLLDQLRALLQAGPVTRATLPADLVRDWQTPAGQSRLQVFPRGNSNDNTTLAAFTRAVQRVAPHASGPPISTQAAAGTIARAFIEAGVYALIAISLLLLLVLRSVREVAFTLAPVVLSGFLTLATCVLIGQPINFANIIAFPLLFGVGTAFHVYLVLAWRDGATSLLSSSLARAVLFSALATGAAFGSLWLSHHPGTASMGKILMIALAWTLVCALVFEPALLGSQKRR